MGVNYTTAEIFLPVSCSFCSFLVAWVTTLNYASYQTQGEMVSQTRGVNKRLKVIKIDFLLRQLY